MQTWFICFYTPPYKASTDQRKFLHTNIDWDPSRLFLNSLSSNMPNLILFSSMVLLVSTSERKKIFSWKRMILGEVFS